MSHSRLRKGLVIGGLAVALGCAATLALAAHRIKAEQAAFRAPAVARCQPTAFNRSAMLPGTSVGVSPLPGSYDASARTQISLLGVPAAALSSISVRGSHSGRHEGRLHAYSQGDGGSFVIAKPLTQGEAVTVRGKVRGSSGKRASFAFHFTVATQDVLPYSKPTPPSGKDYNEKQHFHSRPDLEPPGIVVTTRSPQAEAGDIFAAPYTGPGPPGTMIFDDSGNLVWFRTLPKNAAAAANLQVQQLGGKPVLTWWQGYIPPQGFGQGEEIIDDTSYRQIGRVRAGNGYSADLHEFKLTPQGTALLTAFRPINCNLAGVGGPSGGAVTDSIYQEIDLRTGLVRREWHSLDHVPMRDSYSLATHSSKKWPFDYFHLNSIDQRADGTTLISARNTWAMYELSTTTGRVLNTIGGRHSRVKLGPGTRTAYQHDAKTLPNGTISVFDNGSVPKVHPQSRGLVLSLNQQTDTASVVAQYEHTPALTSDSQGNIQQLANQDMFVGWGPEPYFSEYTAGGQLVFDAHMHGSYESYRGYRFAWTGAPTDPPALAATSASRGRVRLYASWNGDTRTASWRVLAGSSAQTLAPVASAPRSGFETSIVTPRTAPYVAVQALDAAGAVLGTSRAVRD
ncbi:MAG TPA: arylsulfotransferase family protein [Solirubrobacteraceae bacterium]|nr:arylsulfotransferase family protein [Solirubrobacteraceae bacterium]